LTVNLIDRAIAALSPQRGLERVRARVALTLLMNHDAATTGRRAGVRRYSGADADTAAAGRARLRMVARDMVRNVPLAARAVQVITNSVVGDGVIWKAQSRSKARAAQARAVLKAHFDTTAIDARGRCNLYGLQRLVMQAVVESGEVLVMLRPRARTDGLPLPFQIEVLEADHLDTGRDTLTVPANGHTIREGIEYDAQGRRAAYWLFPEHPGSQSRLTKVPESVRVPADMVSHVYRPDRPGQMRGVSWFAPVALQLQDLADAQDAQILRQKIAACFAAFRVSPDVDVAGAAVNRTAQGEDDPGGLSMLEPGRIQNLAPGEDIRFASPPAVEGYDTFTRSVVQSIAVGMGITYESLSGDLAQVNFSSARMGRMDMDRNVSAWQWLMLMPMMMEPLSRWTQAAMARGLEQGAGDLSLAWVPPHRMLVDPSREIPALAAKVRAGFASRQGVVRELGFDPEELLAEQIEDRADCEAHGLRFDSDVHFGMAGSGAEAGPARDDAPDDDQAKGKGKGAKNGE
jgi:lambda family phage portal protein